MGNLLPPRELKHVRSHFRDRFLLVGSLAAIVCGISVLLALLPVYAMVRGASVEQDSPPVVTGVFSESEEREGLARARLILRDLGEVASTTTSLLEVLEEVFTARSPGIVITNVSLVRGEEGVIVLGGTSSSRDDISAYRDALVENSRFKSVMVPISVLAGTAGNRFTITITGTF